MTNYLELLSELLYSGEVHGDRTGTGVKSLFGRQLRFDLREGFPLLTTKKVFTKGIIVELLWMLKGDTNIQYLTDRGVHIWDEWADADGNLGPVYGQQWRSWEKDGKTIDQIAQVVDKLKNKPEDRRILVSAWNVGELEQMALPPCHCMFQFYVSEAGGLDCQLYQRSADFFLGVPFNIASYALLTMMLAQVCGLTPRYFIHTFGNVHLYLNHKDQAMEQLTRIPKQKPVMKLNPTVKDIFAFQPEDFELQGYECYPAIKADVAV